MSMRVALVTRSPGEKKMKNSDCLTCSLIPRHRTLGFESPALPSNLLPSGILYGVVSLTRELTPTAVQVRRSSDEERRWFHEKKGHREMDSRGIKIVSIKRAAQGCEKDGNKNSLVCPMGMKMCKRDRKDVRSEDRNWRGQTEMELEQNHSCRAPGLDYTIPSVESLIWAPLISPCSRKSSFIGSHKCGRAPDWMGMVTPLVSCPAFLLFTSSALPLPAPYTQRALSSSFNLVKTFVRCSLARSLALQHPATPPYPEANAKDRVGGGVCLANAREPGRLVHAGTTHAQQHPLRDNYTLSLNPDLLHLLVIFVCPSKEQLIDDQRLFIRKNRDKNWATNNADS